MEYSEIQVGAIVAVDLDALRRHFGERSRKKIPFGSLGDMITSTMYSPDQIAHGYRRGKVITKRRGNVEVEFTYQTARTCSFCKEGREKDAEGNVIYDTYAHVDLIHVTHIVNLWDVMLLERALEQHERWQEDLRESD